MLKAALKATAAGLVTGSFFLVFLPTVMWAVNERLGWPVYGFWLWDVLGIVLIAAGIIIFCYCTGLFVRFGKGTPAPIEPPQGLVRQGIYRYTRNPMYLGYFAIVLGEFFLVGSLALLFYGFLVLGIITAYLVGWEEPKLRERFGAEYDQYCQEVPRWLIRF